MCMAEEPVLIKVSASSEAGYAKRVAGAMAWQLRENGFLRCRAVKAHAVNNAVKAIAICQQRVAAASVTLAADPVFGKPEGNAPATAIEMVVRETDAPRPEIFLEYKVSGKINDDKNMALKLAEAVAAPVREGKGVVLKCIGPAAVYRGILASTIAKGLVFPNAIEAVMVPSWASLDADGAEPVSVIRIEFWGRAI